MKEREREDSHVSVTAKFIYELQAPVTALKFILTSFIVCAMESCLFHLFLNEFFLIFCNYFLLMCWQYFM